MDFRTLKEQIGLAHERLDALQGAREARRDPVTEAALEELRISLEELDVVQDEVRQKSDELGQVVHQLNIERHRYLELFENAPVTYLVTDERGIVLETNRAAEILFGIPRNFIVGKPIAVFVPSEYRQAFRQALAHRGAGELQTEIQTGSGRRFPAALSVAATPEPNVPLQLRWTVRDTSEQMRTETELLASNLELEGRVVASAQELRETVRERERALEEGRLERARTQSGRLRLELLAEGGALLAPAGDVEAHLTAIARHAVQEFADLCLVDLVEPAASLRAVATEASRFLPAGIAERARNDPAIAALRERLVRGGEPERLELPANGDAGVGSVVGATIARDGHVFGAMILAMAGSGRVFEEADRALARSLAGHIAMALDNARKLRDQVEAGRAKDEFLAMLGHELRNPVSAIRNAAAVLQSQFPEARTPVEILTRQSKFMVRLVDDLVDLTRLAHGKITFQNQPIDLGALAHACVEGLAQSGRSDAWRIRVSAGAVRVNGDPARLRQVIENLLENALKFSPPGSPVELEVRARSGQAIVTVRDHGKGIPPEMIGRIFDLYVQVRESDDSRAGGLGLGLALTRRLVELHGGRIEVHSAGPDAGSEFTVRLPLGAGAEETAPPHEEPLGADALRILVIEDNADSREAFRLLLELWGHQVHEADDGPSGLEAAAGFAPDVVFVDIGLPGMDGYEVARHLRAECPATRHLVALTGFGRPGDRRRAFEAGFHEHLLKPPAPEEVAAVLARAAESRAAR